MPQYTEVPLERGHRAALMQHDARDGQPERWTLSFHDVTSSYTKHLTREDLESIILAAEEQLASRT